ncbi:hypothetical protein [Paenibacillus medicaginis]|uniref:Uncharacterized protein n=1 Tax=Paenibacillus medicaginis TaxID=1470560 RepID=A0ABV5C0Y5_9BACL
MPYTISNNTHDTVRVSISADYSVYAGNKDLLPGESLDCVLDSYGKLLYDTTTVDLDYDGSWDTCHLYLDHTIDDLLNKGLTVTGSVSEEEKDNIKKREEEEVKREAEQKRFEERRERILHAREHFADEWKNLTFAASAEEIRAVIVDCEALRLHKTLQQEDVTIQVEASLCISESSIPSTLREHVVTADVEFSIYGDDKYDTHIKIYMFVYCDRRSIFDFASNPEKFAALINDGFGDAWGYNLHERSKWGGKADKSTNYCNLRVELQG